MIWPNNNRVVVTGVGAITPLGNDLPLTWKAMISGKSGIEEIASWGDLAEVKKGYSFPENFSFIAGEVKGFDPKKHIHERKPEWMEKRILIKPMDHFSQYAVAAALEAVNDSRLGKEFLNSRDAGVAMGTGIGGIKTIEEECVNFAAGNETGLYTMLRLLANMAAGNISKIFGTKGINITSTNACAASANAIIDAWLSIMLGESRIVLCGGAESGITPQRMLNFHRIGALCKNYANPQSASRPFDGGRNGFVTGEGGCVMILELLDSALERGAKIYAEIAGSARNSNGGDLTNIDTEEAQYCMQSALASGGISAGQVDLINAHATSTPSGDKNESQAIFKIFGKRPSVTASKSEIGHLLGASGAFQAIMTVLSIYYGLVPPILNLGEVGSDCADLNYVRETTKADIDCAITNSFGFGGTNACLVFKKYNS
jgi:3-oxoacyl-[acyl-carrier-protein] synthase II